MNFPILSSLILLPIVGALFLFFTKDKEGNNLLADLNSLTSEGSQSTGLIEGIKNKFKIKQESKNREQQQNQALLDHQKRLDNALNDIKLKEQEESFMNFANQYPGLLGGPY